MQHISYATYVDLVAVLVQDKRVKDVMTPMNKVYMIEAGVRLNFEHMLEIYKSGYTRIPVYDKDPQNIIGILYTKDLILVDPGVNEAQKAHFYHSHIFGQGSDVMVVTHNPAYV